MNNLIVLRVVAVLGILASVGLAWWNQQLTKTHTQQLAANQDAHKAEIDDLKRAQEKTLNDQATQHDAAVAALTAEHEKRIDSLRTDQRKQMTAAFKEFESIFEGNKKTIDYINALERRVQSGQAVSKAEVEKLAVIATGLGYLQKEYQKPMGEFKELEQYLARQTAALPARSGAESEPKRFGFLRRMFSKEYREEERQKLRDEGAREAFEAAQVKFNTVYASAQKQMAAVGLNADGYAKKLYALMEEKGQANAEDLSGFFEQARKALKTHQEVLDFEPPTTPEVAPRP
jgi:Tfp pilus assembly protein PilE